MNVFMKNSLPVLAATAHLLDEAGLRTKSGDPLELLAKKFGDHSAEVLSKLGASNTELLNLKANLDDINQRLAYRGGGSDSDEADTPGQQFVKHEELNEFSNYRTRPARLSMQVKTTITTGPTSAGALKPQYRDETVGLPQRRMTVRDLLPTVKVTAAEVQYAKQKTRTSNAAIVPETTLKPESGISWELKTLAFATIAHWIPASRQVLDDIPQLRGLIDSELMYGLKLKEEEQLLNGSGVDENLTGLVTVATPASQTIGGITVTNQIDQIALAILQNALALYPADGVIVNPADWLRMRLYKDSNGNYIMGSPSSDINKTLFGLPVIDTAAMAVDKYLVGNFQLAATLYDRWEARIEVSTEHADFFLRNMVAILCEERLGLAIKNPLALTYGDFGNVA